MGEADGTKDGTSKPFDWFELFVAVLLGLSATGGAVASLFNDQWDGEQADRYSSAANEMTKASAYKTEATTVLTMGATQISSDLALDVQAKKMVIEGLYTKDAEAKTRNFTVAKYLYTQSLSDGAYKAMGFPMEYRTKDEDKALSMPDQVLITCSKKDLEDNDLYIDTMLYVGQQMFKQADAQFKAAEAAFNEGRKANDISDRFGLAGVFYTVAMFLAGIGLVFKSGLRWHLAALGLVTFVGVTVYMFTLQWT